MNMINFLTVDFSLIIAALLLIGSGCHHILRNTLKAKRVYIPVKRDSMRDLRKRVE